MADNPVDDVNEAYALMSSAFQILSRLATTTPTTAFPTGPSSTLVQNVTASQLSQMATSSPPGIHQARSSVQAELRSNFQPYARPRRGASSAAPVRRSASALLPWSRRFVCLASPDEYRVPNSAQLHYLERNSLGSVLVSADKGASHEKLKTAILNAFPMLREVGFDMLVSHTGGRNCNEILTRISNDISNISVPFLMDAGIRGIIYLRPRAELLVQPVAQHSATAALGNPQTENRSTHQLDIPNDNFAICDLTDDWLPDIDSHSDILTIPVLDSHSEVLTLPDLRQKIYDENRQNTTITVQHDDYIMQVLGVYKNPQFNFLAKPEIIFIGEPGRDLGALQKEYFWKGMQSISGQRFEQLPLFEGDTEHRIPTCDATLLRAGIYEIVGKFMSHAALHTGVAFIGLSKAVAEYICKDVIGSNTPFTMTVDDVPDFHIRQAILAIDKWPAVDEREKSNISNAAMESGFYDRITEKNKMFLREHLIYHNVIEKRKAQLDSIKQGFNVTPVGSFLAKRDYLIGAAFPAVSDMMITVSMFIEKLKVKGSEQVAGSSQQVDRIRGYFEEFLQQNSNEQKDITRLLTAWTGWPFLLEGTLNVSIVAGNCPFKVRTCFAEVEVPLNMAKVTFMQYLKLIINAGVCGFGGI